MIVVNMEKQLLMNFVKQGLSQREIAKETNTSQTTVRYWLKVHGLKTLKKKTGRVADRKDKVCLACGRLIPNRNKYCDNVCQNEYTRRKYIKKWYSGEISGNGSVLSAHIRNHLISKSNEECSECGYKDYHPIDGYPILEIDHLDGDHTNNRPENLRVLCPNCHAKTSTYGSRNKGKGRRNFRIRYHQENASVRQR